MKLAHTAVDPSSLDIFHYVFSYAGVLTGPYYTFRTFHDYINSPFSDSSALDKAVIARIKMVPVYTVLFLVSGYIFPLKVVNPFGELLPAPT